MIIISFENQVLHDSCVELERAEQLFGSVHAGALVTFLSDAWAFENACELIAFLDGGAKIGPDDSLSVAIGTDYRATLVVVGKRFARDSHGRVVWASVTRLKLTEISRLS